MGLGLEMPPQEQDQAPKVLHGLKILDDVIILRLQKEFSFNECGQTNFWFRLFLLCSWFLQERSQISGSTACRCFTVGLSEGYPMESGYE